VRNHRDKLRDKNEDIYVRAEFDQWLRGVTPGLEALYQLTGERQLYGSRGAIAAYARFLLEHRVRRPLHFTHGDDNSWAAIAMGYCISFIPRVLEWGMENIRLCADLNPSQPSGPDLRYMYIPGRGGRSDPEADSAREEYEEPCGGRGSGGSADKQFRWSKEERALGIDRKIRRSNLGRRLRKPEPLARAEAAYRCHVGEVGQRADEISARLAADAGVAVNEKPLRPYFDATKRRWCVKLDGKVKRFKLQEEAEITIERHRNGEEIDQPINENNLLETRVLWMQKQQRRIQLAPVVARLRAEDRRNGFRQLSEAAFELKQERKRREASEAEREREDAELAARKHYFWSKKTE
jgi:hypothetical protein